MRLIDADVLKELIQEDIGCGDNCMDLGYLNAMDYVMNDLINRCPVMDLERTLRHEYAEGYRDGKNECETFYDSLWGSKQEEQNNEIN